MRAQPLPEIWEGLVRANAFESPLLEPGDCLIERQVIESCNVRVWGRLEGGLDAGTQNKGN